jgi:small multidrug resistance family-3 protein
VRTLLLYFVTAMAEIVGCYLPWLWLKKGGSVWLLLPAAVSLAAFAWLLTLHEAASGRVYAAYGGMYISVAILWLWTVDGIRPSAWDVAGVVNGGPGSGGDRQLFELTAGKPTLKVRFPKAATGW